MNIIFETANYRVVRKDQSPGNEYDVYLLFKKEMDSFNNLYWAQVYGTIGDNAAGLALLEAIEKTNAG